MKADGSSDGVAQSTTEGIGPGTAVLVVGPSGSGKDALIAGARSALRNDARFAFIERHISRPPHASEDHVALSEAELSAAVRRGDYALSWRAHGLLYGVPPSLDDAVRAGKTAVVNASRTIVPAARQRYRHVRVVLIDCPIEVRAARMALRGRDQREESQQRLSRTVDGFDPAHVDARIDNSGTIAAGVEKFLAALGAASHPG